jgi:hypothetical protein
MDQPSQSTEFSISVNELHLEAKSDLNSAPDALQPDASPTAPPLHQELLMVPATNFDSSQSQPRSQESPKTAVAGWCRLVTTDGREIQVTPHHRHHQIRESQH